METNKNRIGTRALLYKYKVFVYWAGHLDKSGICGKGANCPRRGHSMHKMSSQEDPKGSCMGPNDTPMRPG